MLAKKTSKNQLTLPAKIVKEFPDIDYFDITVKDNKIIMVPVVLKPQTGINTIREKMKKLGINGKDIEEAITWARKKKK
ncbi:MAG TPA: AbrB/MazE/SpoVT family DNA-binding domain-containing protein [Spirochaetota bacterium]|nr:AbrB/MazE/SpoVT family DNA-binding domain-containing protein [Spirochaetota bacterium]HOJ30108.1 AbrB/MazE/SpoVT family DNA-binding domain-containing protein [Spirochaetota bacterium]HOM11033.1 AbrB/MazE/SpoVT family DNA-binding domain-containing protein [Spirochaetota bacterium]HPP50845.1 AbrB/MazE/SpoVT family DNA-binding domain-containing protein [Spirochaetota bacterium]